MVRAVIPKRFHRFWTGGAMPQEFVEYGEEWNRLHPTWEFITWTDHDLGWMKNRELFDRAPELMPRNVGQFCADIARLELLYRFGGVWIDCDLAPQKPIDSLLDEVELFAAWEVKDVWINNAIFGSIRQHPFIRLAIDALPESVAAHPDSGPNVVSGPQFLTALYQQHRPDMKIVEPELFYPYLYSELHREGEAFPDAFAVHRWSNRRDHGKRARV